MAKIVSEAISAELLVIDLAPKMIVILIYGADNRRKPVLSMVHICGVESSNLQENFTVQPKRHIKF